MKKLCGFLAVMVLFAANSAWAHEFDFKNLLFAAAKMQPKFDYDANAEPYMSSYSRNEHEKYRNDEFEFADRLKVYSKLIRDSAAAFDLNEEFIVNTSFRFGEYDFNKASFQLSGIDERTYYSDHPGGAWVSFPEEYRVFFKNGKVIKDLSMPKEKAKQFVAGKKNRYGDVERVVPVTIKFKLVGMKANSKTELMAVLTNVAIYEDGKRTVVLQEQAIK